jgi:hypothetical protein
MGQLPTGQVVASFTIDHQRAVHVEVRDSVLVFE